MSDLPDIKNGASAREIGYNGEPRSHFQRLVRFKQITECTGFTLMYVKPSDSWQTIAADSV